MKLTPTLEEIEANDRLREEIYKEQKTMREYDELEKHVERQQQAAAEEFETCVLDLMAEIEERDREIDEWKGKVESLETEVADLEVKIESMLSGKAYCNI